MNCDEKKVLTSIAEASVNHQCWRVRDSKPLIGSRATVALDSISLNIFHFVKR